MGARAALSRMLAGTGLTGEQVARRSFRLVAAAPPPPPATIESRLNADIIVNATKRSLPLTALAGEVERVSFDTPLGKADQRGGISGLVTRIPSLSSTFLGAGRDKLFLRGIADSSFSGRTQGALGEYLGEARLNYNAPDPGLLLYDMKQIDILKGPQGTLYGGGTLAGVLRLEPERPDLTRTSGFVDLAASATQSGAPGYALAAVLNMPIAQDTVGSRFLAYRTLSGGYIDDARRGRSDVNRTATTGVRGQIRTKLQDWTVDLIATHQRIASRDADYAERGLPADTRASSVAQPSSNSFTLLDLEAVRHGEAIDTTSTTSVAWNRLASTYDAEPLVDRPAAYREGRSIQALNHETRVSHSSASGSGWLAGAAILAQHEYAWQDARDLALPDLTTSFRTNQIELAAFGDYSLAVRRLIFTVGARITYAHFSARAAPSPFLLPPATLDRDSMRVLPMATVTWRATPRLTISAGYRQGYRGSGAELVHVDHFLPQPPGFTLSSYIPDTIQVASLSISQRGGSRKPYTIEVTLSGIAWNRIQADLIDPFGFVETLNTGHANLLNLDAAFSFKPFADLKLLAGVSFNKKYIRPYGPGYEGLVVGEFASIPNVSGYADATWSRALSADCALQLEGRLSYIGRSRLGPDDLHSLVQGRILASTAIASIAHRNYAVSLSVDNLANRRGNLFAYGNPFSVRDGRQITPQRPRTVTIALHAGF